MDDNWDLHAIVRACYNATATSSPSAAATTNNTNLDGSSSFSPLGSSNKNDGNNNKNNHQQLNTSFVKSLDNLHEFYKPPISSNPHPPTSLPPISLSLTTLSASKAQSQVFQQQQQHFKRPGASTISGPSRSKKRKKLAKKVCHVPADALSSDVWAWRKYGQKPIKGSPYPRGYYRCSSSKNCLARKQVERNKLDPSMFIVTYTAEHNHSPPTQRNSLAGSTRQKPQTTSQQPSGSSDQANSLDEVVAPQSQSTKSFEDVVHDEDDEQLLLSNMAVNDGEDDFFEGLEEFASSPADETDKFPANFGVNWSATAAGGS